MEKYLLDSIDFLRYVLDLFVAVSDIYPTLYPYRRGLTNLHVCNCSVFFVNSLKTVAKILAKENYFRNLWLIGVFTFLKRSVCVFLRNIRIKSNFLNQTTTNSTDFRSLEEIDRE